MAYLDLEMIKPSCRCLLLGAVLLFAGCSTAGLKVTAFGNLSTGENVMLYTITNSSGASVSVTDYGLRIVSVMVPDRNGRLEDVVVGYGDRTALWAAFLGVMQTGWILPPFQSTGNTGHWNPMNSVIMCQCNSTVALWDSTGLCGVPIL